MQKKVEKSVLRGVPSTYGRVSPNEIIFKTGLTILSGSKCLSDLVQQQNRGNIHINRTSSCTCQCWHPPPARILYYLPAESMPEAKVAPPNGLTASISNLL